MKNWGRIQSQGEKIEKSESWSKGTPLTIIEGKINLSNLKAKHSKNILDEKMNAFDKLEKFMDNSNKQGGINGPISKKL